MGLLDFLSGGSASTPKGFDINKDDFQIKDADKIFGQTQDQYGQAQARGEAIQPKRENFLNVLEQSALGQGPSLAAEQLKQGQERNLAQQLAMAQGQRTSNPAALQRELFRAQQTGAADVAQQAGQARIQESTANRQLYSQNLQAEQAAVDQLTQQYLSMGFDVRSAQQQALAQYNQLQVQQTLGLAGIQAENERAAAAGRGAAMGGLISGAASGLGAAASGGMLGEGKLSTALSSFAPTKKTP